MSPWALLAAAVVFEVCGTTSMKYSDGFSKLWPSIGTFAGYALAFALLAQTLKSMPVSLAYAVWAGAGTALVATVGMAVLGEAASGVRVAGIALIIGGVIAVNLGGAH